MNIENEFHSNGYKIIRHLINPVDFSSYLDKVDEKGVLAPDEQVVGSKYLYKDRVFEKLLEFLVPFIEEQVGHKVYKTYSFARKYPMGAELKPHLDRDACEITLSISLGYEGNPWPLWINNKSNLPVSVLLEPGDAIMFKGREHEHWREKNTFGTSSQVFLHYVDQNGPFSIHEDDN
ncbi:hypothetical protein ACDQ55_20945 [Chitinophaga sp. 30R24]|uniref:hypothetical protein n=1 Tax=Chitinophaga sp. 30R24 TaxID=3248838 RepID=UPI003B909C99